MRRGRAARMALAGALAFPVGVLAFKAVQQGLSDFYVQSARQEIELWSVPKRPLRGDEWPRIMGYLDRSLAIAPGNAWALEELGVLHLRRVGVATQPGQALASARAAYANLRKALVQRPSSPFAWANLAQAKLLLDEIDAELFEALGRATALGPREPEAQQTVAFVGLAAWHNADAAQRSTIVTAFDRMAARNPDKAVDIARAFNRLDLVCDKAATLKVAGTACKTRAPRPK